MGILPESKSDCPIEKGTQPAGNFHSFEGIDIWIEAKRMRIQPTNTALIRPSWWQVTTNHSCAQAARCSRANHRWERGAVFSRTVLLV